MRLSPSTACLSSLSVCPPCPPSLPAHSPLGLGVWVMLTLAPFGCFCPRRTRPARATCASNAHCEGLERPERERRAFVLEIES